MRIKQNKKVLRKNNFSKNLLGFNCAIAASKLRSTSGGASTFCSQSLGGLDGGEIR